MSSIVVNEPATQAPITPSEHLLDVRNVSKKYHLWKSPRERLLYGLWSQVPSWAPWKLQALAQMRKARISEDFFALRDISFTLQKGESVGIIGRNGSGKSTLLQIVCGVIQPSSGSIERSYKRVAALLELGSGFNPEFTGRENVFLNGAILGLRKEEIEAKFDQILNFSEIERFIDQPVKTYSSGMMVRLAFAVQVVVEPDLLIVDEALAVGDVFFQQKCFAHIQKLQEGGCSLLIVSHEFKALQRLCDRGIVLVGGEKHFEGKCEDAIRSYNLAVLGSRTVASQTSIRAPKVDAAPCDLISEPDHWIETDGESQNGTGHTRLTRWSCTNEASRYTDHFLPGQTIRLVAEFECNEPVEEASVGFGIRDRMGQLIHGKQQYQIKPAKRFGLLPGSVLTVEFLFTCLLIPSEYTVEFGFIDVKRAQVSLRDPSHGAAPALSYKILCYAPIRGKLIVSSEGLDPIRSENHFGMVDVDARTRSCVGQTQADVGHLAGRSL